MSAQTFDKLGNDSQLVWICNKCIFPNFSTTFLLNEVDFTSEISFGPLSAGSSTSSDAFVYIKPHQANRVHSGTSTPTKKLRVLSLNCNSIKGAKKQAEFCALADLYDPDLILGCESKIDSSVPTYSVFPERYEVFK